MKHYLSFRTRVRNGPYYAILDPSSVADEKTGKTLKRAGFDPFTDQERYSLKFEKKRRSVPDLKGAGREYGMWRLQQSLNRVRRPENSSADTRDLQLQH